tara:strand:- start:1454 stop:1663 length:210 start_codon:yes stop_codon:yes gene_type:complete
MKHILDNLKKYAIPYEYKSQSSIFIEEKDVPTILWLRYIFTSAETIPLKILQHKLMFGKKKDIFSLFIY